MSLLSNAILASVLFVSAMVIDVDGHGRLIDPPNRSSLWRFTDNPLIAPHADQLLRSFNDDNLNCGGAGGLISNNGRCGVCGDRFDATSKENQGGGRYALGIISRRYQMGQILTARVQMTIGHTGFYEFRLCPWNNPSTPVTHECLDRYLLQQENGNTRWNLPSRSSGTYEVRLQLPEGVTCNQCVFQWKHTTNDFPNGGFQERQWLGCADIAIEGPPTTTTVSTTTTTTTEIPTTTTTQKTEASTEKPYKFNTKKPAVFTQIDCTRTDDSFKCLDCSTSYMCAFPNFPIIFQCPQGKACDSTHGGCVVTTDVENC